MKKSKAEAKELAGYIYTFLNVYAPSQKTSSEHTLKAYRTALALYIGFLDEVKGVSPETLCMDVFAPSVIEDWLSWLEQERKCSPQTCNNRLAALRTFLKYLGSRNIKYLHISTAATCVSTRKTIKLRVQGLSRTAVKAILEVPDPRTRIGKRDLTVMVLLYSTAARLDELLSIKLSQIHLDESRPYISIVGKGRKIRTLYLLPKAVSHLKAYLKEFHGENPSPNDYLFFSRSKGKNSKLTQPAIDKMLKKHARVAHEICCEVPEQLHAHQFRHAKATHWLEDGMNIVQISFLLGHANVQTTMVYLDISTDAQVMALATLEDESDANLTKKWKSNGGDLSSFCGLNHLAK